MASRRRKQVRNRNRGRRTLPLVIAALLLITAAGALFALFNTPERRLARYMANGERNLSGGNYTQAIEDYRNAAELDGANAEAYAGLISAQGAYGDAQGVYDAYRDAAQALSAEEAESLRAAAASRLYAIGDAFFAGGDFDNTRSTIALLKEIDEENAAILSDRVVEATAPPVGSVIDIADVSYRVLERQGSSILVVAQDVLEVRPFTETQIGVSWAYSTLRAWLNREWLNNLPATEQAHVMQTFISNPAYPNDPESRAHGDSEDRVFLLSVEELLSYFPAETERATGTPYWTRTVTGRSDTSAVYVSENGSFAAADGRDTSYGVRPAFWYLLD